MPTAKTIKVHLKNHKRLQQYKLDNELKSIDEVIELLLKR